MISLTALTNLSSPVPWGLWVGIYVFLVGISAGAFAVVNWFNIRGNPHLKTITRLGLSLSASTLLAGLLSIQLDLGRIERFYRLIISPNFNSVMGLMIWLYSAYVAILAISILWSRRGAPKLFFIFSLSFALTVIVSESLLFARPPGRLWHSLIFPIHFLSSSLASAIAALLFIAGILKSKNAKIELLCSLSRIALPVFIINLIIELIDIHSFAGIGTLKIWALPLGSIIAITLLRRRSVLSITIAGCVELVVVFLAKYNSLISAQATEPFKGFAKSYIEPRLIFSYIPNAFEFFTALLLVSFAAGLFYFLYKALPLTREE